MPVEKKKLAQRGKAFCLVLWIREMIFSKCPWPQPDLRIIPGIAKNYGNPRYSYLCPCRGNNTIVSNISLIQSLFCFLPANEK